MIQSRAVVPLALLLASCASLCAQPQQGVVTSVDNRSFVLVRDSVISVNGSWPAANQLQAYAHAHPGHYIVFLQNGSLYRLDAPRQLEEAEHILAPMAALDSQQRALQAQQKPLEEQQKQLAVQQKAAEGHPDEQGRIGAEQGRIGEQQGEIGRKQGAIGEQQGIVGRAFYNEVVNLIDRCQAASTCHPA